MLITAILFAAATATSTPIPLDDARRAMDEVRLASEEDGGRLWGKPLFGPTLLVDPQTRFAVASEAGRGGALTGHDGVYTGTLPQNIVLANTATNWNGVRWTMVLWPAIGEAAVQRRQLLLHESWHRIQKDLGFSDADPANPHLDTTVGRIWLVLEFRALAAALRAEGDARTRAVKDALLFRAARRAAVPGAAETERALEDNEGLAEYTGVALRGTPPAETRLALANGLDAIDLNTSFVRSFAYRTGPAYGLLLDAASPGWTRSFDPHDDLGAALGRVLKIEASGDASTRAGVYGGAELRFNEERRERERQQRLAAYRKSLVEGPVLELPMASANFGFDPNSVTPMERAGNAYPKLEVTAAWGSLSAAHGARIASDWSRIFVPAADRENLKLKPGWKVVAGTRTGDYRVVKE